MDATPADRPAMPARVVLFGSEGGFSRAVLQRLLAEGISVAGLVIPGTAATAAGYRDLPVSVAEAKPSALVGLARTRSIPVLHSAAAQPRLLVENLSRLAADVLLVACYPLRIPRAVWQPQHPACWNLHPSLLPRYRGPAPLFWQLRFQERNTGVTLHEVAERFDAGDILARACRPLPADTSRSALADWVAAVGVPLFLAALERYRAGRLEGLPQDEAAASYFPSPTGIDRAH